MSSSIVHGMFLFTITVSGRDKKSTILKLGSLLLCHLNSWFETLQELEVSSHFAVRRSVLGE